MKPRTHILKPGSTFPIVELLFLCAFTLLVPVCAAQTVAPKRIVVLYWDNKEFPGNARFEESLKRQLQLDRRQDIEYFPEYFEASRFPDQNTAASFRDYLKAKYANRTADVVIASADAPLKFLLEYRTDIFANSPIVFVANDPPPPEALAAGAGMTGIHYKNAYHETVDLALRLHPGTKQVFVVSGTPQQDRRFEKMAQEELGDFHKDEITYFTDLPLPELIAKTSSLPPNSVIIYVWQQSLNEPGKLLESYEVLNRIAAASSAPIYGFGTVNLGSGIVGGYLQGPEMSGAKAGELVERILSGTSAREIPVEDSQKVPMFDWRELQRWGVAESSLPPASVVRFKEFTFWELYKWRIVGVIVLVILQTLFIAVLLVERRRRRRAREALDQLNAELETRIEARTAALNAKSRELESFAYSVAHDLKAPLRGIDGYSRLLLEDYSQMLDQAGQSFLQTIQDSTDEMSQLIDDLLAYSRLERRELKAARVEVAPIVNSLVEEKKREQMERPVDFVIDVNGATVLADASGLAQAMRNYLDNAIKFTRNVPEPCIEVGSKENAETCLLWVRDNGIGFDMKYHDRIFDIFQRLNVADDYPGTGIGLAIVRKAMERMGGRAWAISEPGHGATFYLEIPK
ncbi:MAG TPA: ATP-binding protein [Pyrinomonadaceae bacterium]|nr:ATP-binding protein [Pyrinomonadaceae bacterium]